MHRSPFTSRGALALALALLLAPPGRAQDGMPEEQAREEAEARARQAVAAVEQALEAYGRGATLSPEQARLLGVGRLLERPPARGRQPEPEADPLEAEQELPELQRLRAMILGRLQTLAPDRYPEERSDRPAPRAPARVRVLDVQDLVTRTEDHLAPNVGLGAGLDPSGARVFGSEAEWTPGTALDADKLIELIETRLGDDHEGSVEYARGRLVLRLPAAQVARVEALLAELRQGRGGLVDLEVRVYRMPASLFGSLRGGALDAEGERRLAAAVAGGAVTLVSSQRVLAHDGQRVAVFRGRQMAFVGDIEVNQTGVVPVLNPVVSVLTEGLAVEVRPLVDRATRRVLLDVALSVTALEGKPATTELQGMTLEFPELGVARTSSTGSVPLGQGTLLGGVFTTGEAAAPVASVIYVRPTLVRQ